MGYDSRLRHTGLSEFIQSCSVSNIPAAGVGSMRIRSIINTYRTK